MTNTNTKSNYSFMTTIVTFVIFMFMLYALIIFFNFLGFPVSLYANYVLWLLALALFYVFLPRKSSVLLD